MFRAYQGKESEMRSLIGKERKNYDRENQSWFFASATHWYWHLIPHVLLLYSQSDTFNWSGLCG